MYVYVYIYMSSVSARCGDHTCIFILKENKEWPDSDPGSLQSWLGTLGTLPFTYTSVHKHRVRTLGSEWGHGVLDGPVSFHPGSFQKEAGIWVQLLQCPCSPESLHLPSFLPPKAEQPSQPLCYAVAQLGELTYPPQASLWGVAFEVFFICLLLISLTVPE